MIMVAIPAPVIPMFYVGQAPVLFCTPVSDMDKFGFV